MQNWKVGTKNNCCKHSMPEKEIQPPDTTIKLGSFSFYLHMTDLRLHNSALYEKNLKKNKKQ